MMLRGAAVVIQYQSGKQQHQQSAVQHAVSVRHVASVGQCR